MLAIEVDNNKKLNAEWRFLVRRTLMLCDEIDRAASPVFTPGVAHSRETGLQLEAFRERRESAFLLIELIRVEGSERLAGQLEAMRRLVSGLECSRSFFVSPPSAAAG
jgi:hypothetical protein